MYIYTYISIYVCIYIYKYIYIYIYKNVSEMGVHLSTMALI